MGSNPILGTNYYKESSAMKFSKLDDDKFKEACDGVKDALMKHLGDTATVADVTEVMNTVLIGCAFSIFTQQKIKDDETMAKNRDHLATVFLAMWEQYAKIYVNNFDKFQEMVAAKKKELGEEFGAGFDANMDEAQKAMMNMFEKFGVDTTKMKQ
jgi:hypothetical protein